MNLPGIRRNEYSSSEALAADFADWTAKLLADAIASRGVALLIVSGGNTPRRYFGQLSNRKIDWSRVMITLADERCVADDSPRSNARMIRAELLAGPAAAASFTPLFDPTVPQEQALASAAAQIALLPLPADLVVLGMGDDGHTASWFPSGDNLAAALDISGAALVLPMRAPGAPEPRLTLTARVLLRARALALQLEGADKLVTLAKAMGSGSVDEMPIRAVLRGAADRLTLFVAPSSLGIAPA